MLGQHWQQVEEWMGLYGDRIMRVVFLVVNDIHLAEEITQDVFIKAYENADNFRSASAPYTWLYRIALNLSRNNIRRRRRFRLVPWEDDVYPLHVLEEPLVDHIIRRDTGRQIRRCLRQLPIRYLEVVVLYYYEDLKIGDIAHVLEMPEGTVKSHLARGRKALEKVMRKEGMADAGAGSIKELAER